MSAFVRCESADVEIPRNIYRKAPPNHGIEEFGWFAACQHRPRHSAMACYFDITDEHKQALALAKYLGQRKDDNSIEGTISGYLTNNQLHEATQLFIDNSAAILADNNARHGMYCDRRDI